MGAFDGELPFHEAESTPAGQALTTKGAARFGLGRPARDLVAVTHAARHHSQPPAASYLMQTRDRGFAPLRRGRFAGPKGPAKRPNGSPRRVPTGPPPGTVAAGNEGARVTEFKCSPRRPQRTPGRAHIP
ncbi:hypothetical protein GCM10010425_79030 [Streptomyces spororaveus]|uniref:Uncharacterized protein n=1 Tax=Streptomyces spororaveus TaxID=284039 RepID=A0ABQ3TPE9_9ACTN|nr:hypothetical protein Sspor_78370 [Streptomyces spororaveus]